MVVSRYSNHDGRYHVGVEMKLRDKIYQTGNNCREGSVKKIEKRWGQELWIVNDEVNDYCGKILTINPGKGTSLHFHSLKHETFLVTEGTLDIVIVDTETAKSQLIQLEEYDSYIIERNVPHRLQSATGCKLLEISTYHRDEDSYRVIKGD